MSDYSTEEEMLRYSINDLDSSLDAINDTLQEILEVLNKVVKK